MTTMQMRFAQIDMVSSTLQMFDNLVLQYTVLPFQYHGIKLLQKISVMKYYCYAVT